MQQYTTRDQKRDIKFIYKFNQNQFFILIGSVVLIVLIALPFFLLHWAIGLFIGAILVLIALIMIMTTNKVTEQYRYLHYYYLFNERRLLKKLKLENNNEFAGYNNFKYVFKEINTMPEETNSKGNKKTKKEGGNK